MSPHEKADQREHEALYGRAATAQHTPGPDIREQLQRLVIVASAFGANADIPEHKVVAYAQAMADRVNANSRLIIAAPEMRRVLEAVASDLVVLAALSDMDKRHLVAIRSVLAKAEGK